MFAPKVRPSPSGKIESRRSSGIRMLLLSARLFPGNNPISSAALLMQWSGSEFTCPQHPSVVKAWLLQTFLILKKMWCVPRTSWQRKDFLPARCDGSNWPDNFSLLEDNVWMRSNPTPIIPEAFHTDPTFWKCCKLFFGHHSIWCQWTASPAEGKKFGVLTHPVSCRTPKSVWSPGCADGTMEALGAPVQHAEVLGRCDPQYLPGFLPVIVVTRHRSRGI